MSQEFNDNFYSDDEDSYDVTAPVVTLKDGLPVRDFMRDRQTEFEIKPDEEGEDFNENSAESFFNFEDLSKVINLNLIDLQSDDNDDDTSPFDKYHRKMSKLREDGKIMKHIVKQGFGSVVPESSLVYIRYQAYVEYAEVPFDSTFLQCNGDADRPVPINLGRGEVIPGLHESILSMRKGEKAEFLIHPDLAYGKLGCAPRIPPDATVLFIVEVDRFIDCADLVFNNDDINMEDRNEFCNVYTTAQKQYMMANDLFNRDNLRGALAKYRQVINMMHNARLKDEAEEQKRNHFLLKNYTNSAVCYHKLKNFKRVCTMATDAITVNQTEAFKNAKLMYFWGNAKMMLGDFEAAKKYLLIAKKLKPLDSEVMTALTELEKKKSSALFQEKAMMQRAFGFQSKPKVTEINEAEEAFIKTIDEQLRNFINNPDKDSFVLKNNFTKEEEQICLKLAKDLNLYARVIDGDKRVIEVKKPAE